MKGCPMATRSSTNDLTHVMTPNPVALPANTSLVEAARTMRNHHVGDVIVLKDGEICGVVTDRDIVVRAVAEDLDPNHTFLGDICSRDLVTVGSDASVEEAIQLMRDNAIRRLPVVDNGSTVGIVSIGDLAVAQHPDSALADITDAPANT